MLAALLFLFIFICANAAAPHFLTVCTKVNGEDGSLIEFIEYHRIQGVTKFVFYAESTPHDRSSSFSATQLSLLAELYQQRGLPDLVSIEHTSGLVLSGLSINAELLKATASLHRVGQISAFRHCLAKYGGNTEWLITMDADEFLSLSDEGPKDTNVAEYFKEFSNLLYAEGPPHREYTLGAGLRSPSAASYLKNLYAQNSAEWVPYVKNGTLGGILIGSAPFGSAGQFWDINAVLMRDPVSGVVDLYFDPRDNFVYNSTLSLPSPSLDLNPMNFLTDYKDAAEVVWADRPLMDDTYWDDSARKRIGQIFTPEVVKLLTSNDSEAALNFFVDKLREDYKEISARLPVVPILPLNELRNDSLATSFMRPIMEAFDADLKHFSQLLTKREAKITTTVLDDLHKTYGALWSAVYPLRLERAVWRTPTFALGDKLEDIQDRILSLYPECADWIKTAKEYIEKHPGVIAKGDPFPPEISNSAPHAMCAVGHRAPAYSDYTQVGKTAYWVGEWRRLEGEPEDLRTDPLGNSLFYNGSDTGCLFPWVHYCGFRQPSSRPMVIARTNPIYEVRINHHMVRSYFRRTLAFPAWRKKAVFSYFDTRGERLFQFEQFANDIRDTFTRKWVPELRAAIRALRPRPRLMRHDLLLRSARAMIRHHGILSVCDFGERLSDSRAMCPASHPTVGFAMPKEPPPPSPLIAGGWCTNRSLVDESGAAMMQRALETSLRDVHMCPGWPEVSCCNYDSTLEATLTQYTPSSRPANVSAWLLPNVCVQCAPLDY